MKKVMWFIKCPLGFCNIKDGSVCWFSANYWDVHDYHISKGGDGIPSHFFEFICPNCNKKFSI